MMNFKTWCFKFKPKLKITTSDTSDTSDTSNTSDTPNTSDTKETDNKSVIYGKKKPIKDNHISNSVSVRNTHSFEIERKKDYNVERFAKSSDYQEPTKMIKRYIKRRANIGDFPYETNEIGKETTKANYTTIYKEIDLQNKINDSLRNKKILMSEKLLRSKSVGLLQDIMHFRLSNSHLFVENHNILNTTKTKNKLNSSNSTKTPKSR